MILCISIYTYLCIYAYTRFSLNLLRAGYRHNDSSQTMRELSPKVLRELSPKVLKVCDELTSLLCRYSAPSYIPFLEELKK